MKLRDSNGGENYVIPFSSGGIKPPHVKRIGPAYPLFLKFEDMVTTGDGTDGIVLGGRPIRDCDIATQLGIHAKTIFAHRGRLARYGYIAMKRTPHGYVIRVHKSKKWASIQERQQSENRRQSDGVNRRRDGAICRRDGAVPTHVDQTLSGRKQDVVTASPLKEGWKIEKTQNATRHSELLPILEAPAWAS